MTVDLAIDYIDQPPESTSLGPTLTRQELATNKVLALFGRMEARDFEDVWALSHQYAIDQLMTWAAEKDAGFEAASFQESLRHLRRLPDEVFTLPTDELATMRSYFLQLDMRLGETDAP